VANILWKLKKRMRWARDVARIGDGRDMYNVLVGKPDGKRPMGGTSSIWEDKIKMDLQEVRCGGMDWIDLTQDRQVAGTCECGNELSGFIKSGEFFDTLQTG
jgi:hypothetical protein